jgi:hypothetical protein
MGPNESSQDWWRKSRNTLWLSGGGAQLASSGALLALRHVKGRASYEACLDIAAAYEGSWDGTGIWHLASGRAAGPPCR